LLQLSSGFHSVFRGAALTPASSQVNTSKLARKNSLQRSVLGGWIPKRNVQQSSHVEIKLGWRHYQGGENKYYVSLAATTSSQVSPSEYKTGISP